MNGSPKNHRTEVATLYPAHILCQQAETTCCWLLPSAPTHPSRMQMYGAPAGMMSNNPVMQFGGMHPPISDHTLYSSLSYSGGGPSSSGPPQYMRIGGSMTETTDEDGDGARAVKRARLVWTPQLHKRFEEAVSKLGPEKSIPKNIMQVRCMWGWAAARACFIRCPEERRTICSRAVIALNTMCYIPGTSAHPCRK